MPGPAREQLVHLWADSSGMNPAALRPGRDLVLRVPTEHGLGLTPGVALDDHLDADARALVDTRAGERYASWRERWTPALHLDELDFASIWEIELRARCFYPAARLEIGLPSALDAAGAAGVALRGLPGEVAAAVRAVAGDAVDSEEQPVSGRAAAHPPARRGRAAQALAAVGVPSLVRGQVLSHPYWNVAPVYERLAGRRHGLRPVASGVMLPGLGPLSTVRAAIRGGWLGHPGPRARRRAEADATRMIDSARPGREAADPLEAAIDDWALRLLRARAGALLAAARHARAAFARGSVRCLLLPFDGTADGAMLVDESRRAGVPSLLVQHGFDARLGAPDKGRADVVALWSERDRGTVPSGSSRRIAVTGNPGAERLVGRTARVPRRDRTLILVDYPSRLSARITERVGQRHVAAALEALAAVRPGTTAVIRPHPSELAARAYLALPADLPMELDGRGSIEETLSGVDLCIGAMSTATLQAGTMGVPVAYLEVTGHARPWPLDGSVLPTGHDAGGLREAIRAALAGPGVVGQAEMIEALGARGGATDAVCDLIDQLVGGKG